MSTNHKTLLIKLGGSILQDEDLMASISMDIKILLEMNYRIVLVHGGSKAINQALAVYGMPSQFINGLRVTSIEAMKIIEMVLCGQVNQLIVRKLNAIGCAAIGLSGAENNMFLCDPINEQLGCVGAIKAVNTQLLQQLLQANPQLIPVVSSIGIDKYAQALNINADSAAYKLAQSLAVDALIFLTDQDGVYNHNKQILPQLNTNDLNELISQGIVKDGMLVKINAILNALDAGLKQIKILNGKQNHILIDTLMYQKNHGTECVH